MVTSQEIVNDANSFANKMPEINNELTINYGNVWSQRNISKDLYLFGFFEFKTGTNKTSGDPFCFMTGVSRFNLLEFIRQSGFRKRYSNDSNSYEMVRVTNGVMEPVTIDMIRVVAYIEMLGKESVSIEYEKNWNFSKELMSTIYLKNQDQIFNKNFLELLDEYTVPELKDTHNTSYFLFSNRITEVTTSTSKDIPYEHLQAMNRCVWKSHIMNREYNQLTGLVKSEFENFIHNVAGNDMSRINAFKSAIGHLLHRHNGSHMGQAVVCYDEQLTDVNNPQGGTGKGVFTQSVGQMRELASIDGKRFKADDRFNMQTVKRTTNVAAIDDLNKDVSLDPFFSCLTEGFTIERKHQDTIKLKPEDSPKMLFTMNTAITGNGSSHRRRMFILEFSDHYSKKIKTGHEHPIEDEHGILFDRINWKSHQWDAFTGFMIGCLTYYLQNGLQPYELINVGKNTLIQNTGQDFAEWVQEQNFEVGKYYATAELFKEYKLRFYGEDAVYKQRSFTNLIKKFAGVKGWEFKLNTDQLTKRSEFTFQKNA